MDAASGRDACAPAGTASKSPRKASSSRGASFPLGRPARGLARHPRARSRAPPSGAPRTRPSSCSTRAAASPSLRLRRPGRRRLHRPVHQDSSRWAPSACSTAPISSRSGVARSASTSATRASSKRSPTRDDPDAGRASPPTRAPPTTASSSPACSPAPRPRSTAAPPSPMLFRLGAGALLGSVKDTRSGSFTAVPSKGGGMYPVDPVSVTEDARLFYVAPEARFGYRFGGHFRADPRRDLVGARRHRPAHVARPGEGAEERRHRGQSGAGFVSAGDVGAEANGNGRSERRRSGPIS